MCKKCKSKNEKDMITATVVNDVFVNRNIYRLNLKSDEFLGEEKGPCRYIFLKGKGFMRPITISGQAGKKGDEIELYIKKVGNPYSNTRQFAKLKFGDKIEVSRPRGKIFKPSKKVNKYILAAGGSGVAAIRALVPVIAKAGKKIEVALGYPDVNDIFGTGIFSEHRIQAKIAIENYSNGCARGFVTVPLKDILEKNDDKTATVIACGPKPMLEAVFELCKKYRRPCYVIIEEFMGCAGKGACKSDSILGGYGKKRIRKLICKDGPMFNARWIDWKEFMHSQPAKPIKNISPKTKKPFKTVLKFKDGRKLELEYPWMVASGCLGSDYDLNNPALKHVGAIITKGISLYPCLGNPMPRMCELPTGSLNSIGLEGVGVDRFLVEALPKFLKLKKPVIVNIWGKTIEEIVKLVRILDSSEIAAYELNISCPNVKVGGMAFGSDPLLTYQLVSAVRYVTEKPMIVKLTPNVTNIVEIAKQAVLAEADALTIANTYKGMAIDINTKRPRLGSNYGGYSGLGIKPMVVCNVNQVREANPGVPIFASGGVGSPDDAIEMNIAGADAVQLGIGFMMNNNIFNSFVPRYLKYMKEQKVNHIQDLVGSVDLYPTKK